MSRRTLVVLCEVEDPRCYASVGTHSRHWAAADRQVENCFDNNVEGFPVVTGGASECHQPDPSRTWHRHSDSGLPEEYDVEETQDLILTVHRIVG
jgi:hypothetical protein